MRASSLLGSRVGLIVTDGVETDDVTTACRRFGVLGAAVELIAPHDGEIQSSDASGRPDYHPVDVVAYQARAADFDALVVPGTGASRHRLETNSQVVNLVADMLVTDGIIGLSWNTVGLLDAAGSVYGCQLASSPARRDDGLVAAPAANWLDGLAFNRGVITTGHAAFQPVVEAVAVAITQGNPLSFQMLRTST